MSDSFINYLITDPKFYSKDEKQFKKNLQKVLKNNQVDMACFRDKESKNYKKLAKIFVKTCKKFKIKRILINGDYKLSHKLHAHGVHLNSTQFNDIKKAKELDLYTVISCHNFNDLDLALDLHANAVTYSPIFKTPHKGKPKGLDMLKEVVELYEDIDVIALGGIISKEQIKGVKKTKAKGFASIRYFIQPLVK